MDLLLPKAHGSEQWLVCDWLPPGEAGRAGAEAVPWDGWGQSQVFKVENSCYH